MASCLSSQPGGNGSWWLPPLATKAFYNETIISLFTKNTKKKLKQKSYAYRRCCSCHWNIFHMFPFTCTGIRFNRFPLLMYKCMIDFQGSFDAGFGAIVFIIFFFFFGVDKIDWLFFLCFNIWKLQTIILYPWPSAKHGNIAWGIFQVV